MQHIEKIRRANPNLAKTIETRCGFVTDQDIPELTKIDRMMLVLVRCGNGRFLCPVQDVQHFVQIIEEHSELKGHDLRTTDYVRDVSLPA